MHFFQCSESDGTLPNLDSNIDTHALSSHAFSHAHVIACSTPMPQTLIRQYGGCRILRIEVDIFNRLQVAAGPSVDETSSAKLAYKHNIPKALNMLVLVQAASFPPQQTLRLLLFQWGSPKLY